MEQIKTRDSNFDLLKIVSMFFIVVTHTITHGKIVDHVAPITKDFVILLRCFLIVHVNSFILVTGYYQYKNKFKLKKIFSLNNARWFYAALIAILLIKVFHYDINSHGELYRALSPVPFEGYWFISCYLYLYILSPFLNKIILMMDKNYYKLIILTGFLICCLFPYFTRELGYDNNEGFSLLNFVYLYFIGAYLHKFDIHIKSIQLKFLKFDKRIILFLLMLICLICNFAIYKIGMHLGKEGLLWEIRKIITLNVFSYDNPFVFVMSLCYMMLFSTISFQSKFVNKVASLTFGVYLIHDNYMINDILYNYLNLANNWQAPKDFLIFPYIFLCALFIFLIGISIELIRQKIFRFISEWESVGKLRKCFYSILDNLKKRIFVFINYEAK